jgi:tRNA uridine 5-carboxymethylaminomethyl modification enzyme
MSHQIGLASDERLKKVEEKIKGSEDIISEMRKISIEPTQINDYFESIGTAPIPEKMNSIKLLLRPQVSLIELAKQSEQLSQLLRDVPRETIEQVEIQLKYEAYIEKEKELVLKSSSLEELVIPETFDYTQINSLSSEAKQKFIKIRPRTLGQAGRISGVNPTDVQILMVHMGR